MTAWLYFLSACLVATAFGEENVSEEKIVFEAFDFLSENNKLSLHEQGRFYTLMDCNRDGTVSKVEAMCMFKEYGLGLPAFIASADDDDDGFITNEEYKAFFSAIDANNNNRVTWGEFQTAWTDFQNSK